MGTLVTVMVSPKLADGCDVAKDAVAALVADGWRKNHERRSLALDLPLPEYHLRGRSMTESTEAITNGLSEEEKQYLVSQIHEKLSLQDDELQFALDTVLGSNDQGNGNSMPLTVFTAGGTISGRVITRDAWKENLYARFTGPMAESMADEEEFLTTQRERISQARAELGAPRPPRRYLHMTDAVIHQGGRPISLGFTRIYVKDIVGWSLGQLKA